jgi:hypothetical protein
MNRYDVCASCSRHTKRTDAACPFCEARKQVAETQRAKVDRRMSRAEWLAFGSAMVLAGCSAKETSTRLDRDVSDAVTPEGGLACGDAQCTSPPDAAIPEAGFGCGDDGSYCVRFAEICLFTGSYPLYSSCTSYDAAGWAPGDPACLAHVATIAPGVDPVCTCSTWSVGPNRCGSGPPSCSSDNAGAVTVSSCHSCYGAPPARLERLGHVDRWGAALAAVARNRVASAPGRRPPRKHVRVRPLATPLR